MQGPASKSTASGGPRPSLSQRAFPRRVRAVLEGVLDYVSDELDRGLVSAMNELEQHLFKLAEQARSNEVQRLNFEALREIKRGRADLTPRFLLGLEASLAMLRDPARRDFASERPLATHELSLLEDVALDESGALNEIAGRAEIRNSLPLFLLGQRFGVIAGRPAFDAEHLPIGPHALCDVLREAAVGLDLNLEYRLHLYRQFDRSVMQFIGPMYEAVNAYLIKQNVLPHLTYVPVRVKPVAQAPSGVAASLRAGGAVDAAATHLGAASLEDASAPTTPATARDSAPAPRATTPMPSREMPSRQPPPAGPHPHTAWPGLGAEAAPGPQDAEMFDVLRQLLAGRRSLLGKLGSAKPAQNGGAAWVAGADDVQNMLGRLQQRAPAPVVVDGKAQPRNITHLKQDLLAQLRSVAPGGQAPVLTEEQGDTIDLVGMLYDHIMKDVRPGSAAANLLTKLQVPLLRVALDDKGFFTRRQHPARQMLNTIAESGAYWSSEDDADRVVVDKMTLLVDRVGREFSGDLGLFDNLLGDLNAHMQTQARKAEVAERRHVEAARGKEKLELARQRAAEAIDDKVAGKPVPKFLHSLLDQAWSDVLALSVLRGGEESDSFRHQLQIAERLVESAVSRRTTGAPLIGAAEAQGLKLEIEEALGQVGYDHNDAQQIATRLLATSNEEEADDPASRTELAMRLKSRTRLGGQAGPHEEKQAALEPAEQAHFDRIKHLPFGTWFEFVINQQGEKARRRMSWFSTVTGHCLFVNHRGQRVGEYSLHWLAREIQRGNVRILEVESESLIDRAWNAVMGALRSFAGRPAGSAGGGA